METIWNDGSSDVASADPVATARAEADRAGVDGVEAWRLPDGTVVAFTTPTVPFGEVRWTSKRFTAA